MIEQRLVDFVHAAAVMTVGTRDARLHPVGGYLMGARMDGALDQLTVYLPEAMGAATAAAARESRVAAVTMGNPETHETYQFKGEVLEVRPVSPDEEAVMGIFGHKMGGALAQLGLPVQNWKLPPPLPALAIVIRVKDMYLQSPGPGAGARIGP